MPAATEGDGPTHLAAARALAPEIRAAREEIERERRLPASLVAAMESAELFSLWRARAVGGPELDLHDVIRVLEVLSAADGSVGWCASVAAGGSFFSGFLSAPAARQIFGDGRAMAGTTAPNGVARPTPGGWRITGRWPFASGMQHAGWMFGFCIEHDADGPRRGPDGAPVIRVLCFPREQAELIDTWRTGGLRGTGSHDFKVDDLFVPAEHGFAAAGETPTQPGALFALPMATVFAVSIAAVPLGIARGAIDAFLPLALGRTPTFARTPLREKATVQAALGRAEGALRSARAWLFETTAAFWTEAEPGCAPSMEQRALVRLACVQCAAAAKQAIELVFESGGGASVYEAAGLERALRDVQTAAQHVSVQATNYEYVGRVMLGLDPGMSRF